MTYQAIDQRGLKREFNARLNEAAQERLARRIRAKQPSIQANIRQAIAKLLISLGQKLQSQPQAEIVPQS